VLRLPASHYLLPLPPVSAHGRGDHLPRRPRPVEHRLPERRAGSVHRLGRCAASPPADRSRRRGLDVRATRAARPARRSGIRPVPRPPGPATCIPGRLWAARPEGHPPGTSAEQAQRTRKPALAPTRLAGSRPRTMSRISPARLRRVNVLAGLRSGDGPLSVRGCPSVPGAGAAGSSG
jgi:hypothetical protein